MYQSEYCPKCGKKTLREIYPCACQNTSSNSEYMATLNVIEEYKQATPEDVRSCLGVECFAKQRLNQQS